MNERVCGFRFALAMAAWVLVASVQASVEEAVKADTAEQAVQLATVEMLALIEAGQAYADDDPERFYREVEALLRPLVDFKRFARNVMGPHVRVASEAQQARFAESFKWSLVRTYALALTRFRDGEVAVLEPRRPPRSPDRVMVTQEITVDGKIYTVDYDMRRNKQALWRLQNIRVEGLNVGLSYKEEFDRAMSDPQHGGDMDKVIDSWTELVERDGVDVGEDEPTEA